MILLHIITEDEKQAIEIVDLLLKEIIILEAVLLEQVAVRKKMLSGKLVTQSHTLTMGKTKALLFNTIDNLLKERYEQNMPVIYSTPIVHMDWEESTLLQSRLEQV